MYRVQSFFNIRISMMAKNETSKVTRTTELMMDNQWISKCSGKKWDLW
jgi:hypothetical protein